jgi:hypothetical protein
MVVVGNQTGVVVEMVLGVVDQHRKTASIMRRLQGQFLSNSK